jgi:hypothetical protein
MAYVLSYSVTTEQVIQKENEDRVFTSAAMCLDTNDFESFTV